MRNSLYYGEIAARISAYLYQNPDHIMQIDRVISQDSDSEDTIWTISATAARVFDVLEDLSEDQGVDWLKALDQYSEEVLDFLLVDSKPTTIDLISMAVRSIKAVS